MQDPNYLAKLMKGREKDPVTVRVVRKWTVKETAAQSTPLYVGMVLADAQVSKAETAHCIWLLTIFLNDFSYTLSYKQSNNFLSRTACCCQKKWENSSAMSDFVHRRPHREAPCMLKSHRNQFPNWNISSMLAKYMRLASSESPTPKQPTNPLMQA